MKAEFFHTSEIPTHGWLSLSVELHEGERYIFGDFSYVTDSITMLATAIANVALTEECQHIIFQHEPGWQLLELQRTNEKVNLKVCGWGPGESITGPEMPSLEKAKEYCCDRKPYFQTTVNLEVFLKCFANSFRKLQQLLSSVDFKGHWGFDFPKNQLETIENIYKEKYV